MGLDVAFRKVYGQFYPTVSLHSYGETVQVNFGDSEFKFDIEGLRAVSFFPDKSKQCEKKCIFFFVRDFDIVLQRKGRQKEIM